MHRYPGGLRSGYQQSSDVPPSHLCQNYHHLLSPPPYARFCGCTYSFNEARLEDVGGGAEYSAVLQGKGKIIYACIMPQHRVVGLQHADLLQPLRSQPPQLLLPRHGCRGKRGQSLWVPSRNALQAEERDR